MENLFNELIKVDNDSLKINKNVGLDKNLLANDWALDYNNSNSKIDLQWSSDYLTQTETTLYNEAYVFVFLIILLLKNGIFI